VKACYAAVVLAGGLSTRMNQFKPLLPIGEATVTDHVIDTFLGTGVDVFLVAGYRYKEIKKRIKKHNITIVYNPDYERGMFSSIQAGVRRLPTYYQAFFMLPIDIPLVRPATIRRLMEVSAENPDNIIYPVFGGKRGHPPLIPTRLIPFILGWRTNRNLKAVLDSYKDLALEIPVADSLILYDIDTPGDYAALLERLRRYEVPTDEEANVILNDICKVPPDGIKHGLKVAEVAAAIARALDAAGQKADMEIVRMAAELYDVAKDQMKHDIVGETLLRELGFGMVGDIIAICSDLEGGNTCLPLEAKIVYLADKLVIGESLVSLEERYNSADHCFGMTPEIKVVITERLKVAIHVKKELEVLLGQTLEYVISELKR
jgi:molybdenum cofactor cytidylyltransferase